MPNSSPNRYRLALTRFDPRISVANSQGHRKGQCIQIHTSNLQFDVGLLPRMSHEFKWPSRLVVDRCAQVPGVWASRTVAATINRENQNGKVNETLGRFQRGSIREIGKKPDQIKTAVAKNGGTKITQTFATGFALLLEAWEFHLLHHLSVPNGKQAPLIAGLSQNLHFTRERVKMQGTVK